MISSLAWIPRGAARSRPVRYELSAEEYGRIKALAALEQGGGAGAAGSAEEEEEDDDQEEEQRAGEDEEPLPAEYEMDKYDDEDEEGEEEDEDQGENAGAIGELGPGMQGEEEFAMLEMGGRAFAIEADDSGDEDAEDDEIRASDSLLVVALTEDEFSHLEVQLLSDDGNMFVHHDIQLPEFPLCLAWLDCPPFQTQGEQQAVGNYIAVGSFNPAIEIWNLDVLDPLEPSATLGGEDTELSQQLRRKGRKGKGKGKDRSPAVAAAGPVLKDGSHQDAVMSLSWNRVYRQALASGSADTTVKIWDVTTQKCSHTFTHHTGKVQSVVFHPEEAWRLATGAFDKTVALLDCRSGATTATYNVPADMECMAWDPFQPSHLYASLENGVVTCIDVRNSKAPLFAFQAHDKTVSSLSFSASVPGYLCTASEDKTIRAWDVAACQAGRSITPEQVSYKSMQVGKLFALQFFPDNPFLLATGGDSGLVAVWESDEMEAIQQRFGGRIQARENEYVVLAGGGTTASAAALVGGASSAPVEQEDDSWMDEPVSTSSATASNAGKKSKSKSKGKVAKSGR